MTVLGLLTWTCAYSSLSSQGSALSVQGCRMTQRIETETGVEAGRINLRTSNIDSLVLTIIVGMKVVPEIELIMRVYPTGGGGSIKCIICDQTTRPQTRPQCVPRVISHPRKRTDRCGPPGR